MTKWWWDLDCHCHIYQLLVHDGLVPCDEFLMEVAGIKYYNTLAKMMNSWREFAIELWRDCVRLYGDEVALLFTRVPPKCIRERWGAVANCEDHVLKPPIDQVQEVFQAVLANRLLKKKKKKEGPQDVHGIRLQSMAWYSEQMSQWFWTH